ncbi:uncharacterized protein N7459_006122 [Penicillium hispanicum]|uniref:uncharacterized protein n=1 Tax=Penicillium hispanicum TaxID=1080232 RepID=UPI002540E37C|nr:uncharacterized protein N7459_006122 [Penicillium hispanicum]KAJ5580137.1 hypothetical protein N7459_006122 [Penicillium hispanicum]
MVRNDIHYARDSALTIPKCRLSNDSASLPLSCSKKNTAREDRRAPKNSGLVPSHLDIEALQEPPLFPEYSDQLYSPEHRQRGSMHSTNITPSMTPNEPESLSLKDWPDAHEYRSQKIKPIKPKVHIKPMLRKMSRDDTPSTSIDLSRSSTEQEGLGIYMNFDRDRRGSESLTGVTYHRKTPSFHHRSTSGTSQFSAATGSSGGKQGSQYVYPMRPTPRAYTPPLSHSYQNSGNDSDGLEDGSPETESKVLPTPDNHRPIRASSGPTPRLSLQIEADTFTRLPGISQTNVSSRPSFGYSRDNGSTLDTASPISRTSLDYVFRSRTRTSTDPISRAAAIQAARQAFEEKEAAKTRRFEKQQIKAEERQTRRQVKRNMSGGQRSPAAPWSDEKSEMSGNSKTSKRVDTEVPNHQQSASWKSQSKGTWMLFMTWLRTRVFKFRRRLRKMN